MVATADLWVYNAENFCVSFFNQVTSIFHLRGGKMKKKVLWAYLMIEIEVDKNQNQWWKKIEIQK